MEFKAFSLPVSILTSQETRPNNPFHMGSRGAFLLWKWLRLVAKRRHRIRVQSLNSYGIQGLQSTRFQSHKPKNQSKWSIPHALSLSLSLCFFLTCKTPFAWSQAKRQLTVPVIPNDGLFSRNRHINIYQMSHIPPQCLFP